MDSSKILILGIGNVLLGDEGVGVHAIKYLNKFEFPENVELIDGGTGGFHLLSLMDDYDPIIMIDATLDDKDAGTLTLIEPKFASDFPKALSSHDIGLRDLVETSTLLGSMPKMYLIAVSIDALDDIDMTLSKEIEQSLEPIHKMVEDILSRLK